MSTEDTHAWLQTSLAAGIERTAGIAPAAMIYDPAGQPGNLTPLEFGRLHRKLKIFRWLERFEFESVLDVAAGWEHLPHLAHERYGARGYYSDLVHALSLPFDGLVFGKLDHAVTLRLPRLPFRDGAFDAVVCSEVFEHLVRPLESIAELLRVARRYVVLTTLEGLATSRWRRLVAHHRVDVRVPHIERNFLLLDELAALFGDDMLHENLIHASAPVNLFGPPRHRPRSVAPSPTRRRSPMRSAAWPPSVATDQARPGSSSPWSSRERRCGPAGRVRTPSSRAGSSRRRRGRKRTPRRSWVSARRSSGTGAPAERPCSRPPGGAGTRGVARMPGLPRPAGARRVGSALRGVHAPLRRRVRRAHPLPVARRGDVRRGVPRPTVRKRRAAPPDRAAGHASFASQRAAAGAAPSRVVEGGARFRLRLPLRVGARACYSPLVINARHAGASLVGAILVGSLALCPAWAAPTIPPGEDAAKPQLEKSPRHGEYATVDVGGTPVRTWVVYPERKDKAPVVIVIHEIFGLTDWIRSVADQLAADGFIAVAPDLVSGKGPNGGGTDAFASRDDVIKTVSGLPRSEVDARLNAVRAYALALPAANGKSASVGFCWGGASSFAYAAAQPALNAAVVYYGVAPPDVSSIKAPVLGLYGEHDARINATLETTTTKMKELGKSYEKQVFAGAGHGFLRAQNEAANRKAAEEAWPKTLAFLREHTR